MSYFGILRPSEAELTAFILVIGSTCDSLLPDRHQSITWIQYPIYDYLILFLKLSTNTKSANNLMSKAEVYAVNVDKLVALVTGD